MAENLITLCVACNSARQDRAITVWRPDIADAVLIATSTLVDRALGRSLCRELDPAFLARGRHRRCAAAQVTF